MTAMEVIVEENKKRDEKEKDQAERRSKRRTE